MSDIPGGKSDSRYLLNTRTSKPNPDAGATPSSERRDAMSNLSWTQALLAM
jgi:hypothetical protein